MCLLLELQTGAFTAGLNTAMPTGLQTVHLYAKVMVFSSSYGACSLVDFIYHLHTITIR